MEECDGGRRRCWAYAAKRPGFSIVQVLFIHILCSRRKILAVPHISSAPRRGDTLLGANRFEGGHHREHEILVIFAEELEALMEVEPSRPDGAE